MKKRNLTLLLLLCLALCACSRPPAPAAAASPASPVPAAESPSPAAPTPTEDPPHEHDFDPETGLCRTCGSPCPHGEGFSSEGRCLLCGWRCDHEQHDAESACCLRCGAQLWHHFGIAGRCEGCGREAPLAGEGLPDAYYEPAEHAGQCLLETVTDAEGKEHSIALWLPWDYSEDGRYNVLILIHGDNGSCRDWTDREQPTARGAVQLCHVYDHMAEEHLCQPQQCGGTNGALIPQIFLGEDVVVEPVGEIVVVAIPAQRRHGKMRVTVNETRHQHHAATVDDAVCMLLRRLLRDVADFPAGNANIGPQDHREPVRHGYSGDITE